MNKRHHQRIEVPNLIANLSDGVDSFLGTVKNVSRVGILLADIPKDFKNLRQNLSVIVSTKDKDFKMLVIPKWVSGNNHGKQMGLVILDAPLDWTIFIMDYEPKYEDMWAASTNLPDY